MPAQVPSTLPPSLRTALVALLLAAHWWLGVSASLTKGITNDESGHLTAGYSYWTFDDYRLQPENGNFPQRLAALPLLLQAPKLDPAQHVNWWAKSDVWIIGNNFLYESGNTPEWMLATARAMIGLLSVATGLLVFLWSCRLWGDWGGLFSLSLYVFSATTLAHGFLITSDMAAAFALLAATGAFWRHLQRPTRFSLVISLLFTGLAVVSKFSFLLLGPIYLLLGFWHWAIISGNRAHCFLRLLGFACAQAASAVLVVWVVFGFRYSAYATDLPVTAHYYFAWETMVPAEGARTVALNFLRDHHLLPEAFIVGLAHVLHASEARLAFAAGQYSLVGWWWFFPYAFLIKTPVAELCALGATVFAALALHRHLLHKGLLEIGQRLAPLAPLIVLSLVYWIVALASNLNIGHRHLLPIYPPLLIVAGVLASGTMTRAWRAGAASLVLLAAADCMRSRPNYLPYFNPLAGNANQRWRHLVDSSLDWGQELPALSTWLRENRRGKEPVYLSYFGLGNPRYEGIEAMDLAPIMPPWRPHTLRACKPGLYCISATMLQDVYGLWRGPWDNPKENSFQKLRTHFREHPEQFSAIIREAGSSEEYQRWLFEQARFARLCTYLRVRTPEAIINSSLLIYRLDAQEVALMGAAPASELSAFIEAALAGQRIKARP